MMYQEWEIPAGVRILAISPFQHFYVSEENPLDYISFLEFEYSFERKQNANLI